MSAMLILCPVAAFVENNEFPLEYEESLLDGFSPVISSAFKRGMKAANEDGSASGAWILLSDLGEQDLLDILPNGDLRKLDLLKGAYKWVPKESTNQLINLADMLEDGYIEAYVEDNEKKQNPRLSPNDPDYIDQWHLSNNGQSGGSVNEDVNITTAWDLYNGSGVTISIVDDGLDHGHPDIAQNYDASTSYDFCSSDADPMPSGNDAHGTAAGGVAGATGNNGIDVIGAGFGANLAGSRLIACSISDSMEANALSHMPQSVDIYSNSWGPADDGATLQGPGPLTLAAIENGVYSGRGGLGNIYTWAAGNGLQSDDDSNADGYTNSRYTIAVTAVDHNGEQSYYSEPGANILVSAPSNGDGVGITTTDISGPSGYTNGDVTNNFGGTSSATPLVSGVISMMLQSNPNLTWRDVQEILVLTSRKNDFTDPSWAQNGAGHWFSHKYGFGVVDAGASTSLASNWSSLSPESNLTYFPNISPLSIYDTDDWVETDITVSEGIKIESLDIIVDVTHPSRGELDIELVSPHDTVSVLRSSNDDTGSDIQDWSFGSVLHWGELSNGTWTLRVKDSSPGNSGTLNSWSLILHGVDSESDHDGDGLLTIEEVDTYGTDPYDPDSDDDGLSDYSEIENGTNPLSPDTDSDGLSDGREVNIHHTDPLLSDSDGDGLLDGQEVIVHQSNPLLFDNDSDRDLYYHFDDCDDDNPMINPGRPEILNGVDDDCDHFIDEGYNLTDRDSDGLKDWDEYHIYFTDFQSGDTDLDGISDGDEVITFLTNPLVYDEDSDADGSYWFEDCNDSEPMIFPGAQEYLDGIDNDCDDQTDEDYTDTDVDQDGISDFEEFNVILTNPFHPDSDGDGLSDGFEISESLTDPLSYDQDSDSDGFYWFEDCDDEDSFTSPLSTEILDKKDNDCDGFQDEDFIDIDSDADGLSDFDEFHLYNTNPSNLDTDGDLLSDGTEVLTTETDPNALDPDNDEDGYYWFEDCNDVNPRINPRVIEIWDGIDQDCDGFVDEDLDRVTELGFSGGSIVWEASNESLHLEAPVLPEGVSAEFEWSFHGAEDGQFRSSSLTLDSLDCDEIGDSDLTLILCESPNPVSIELKITDSDVETVLIWPLEVKIWTPPSSLFEKAVNVLKGPLGYIAGFLLISLLFSCAIIITISRRRRNILVEAIRSYGGYEGAQVASNNDVPSAPDFNRRS
tara:strand:+ start:709 stop:4278 length:3570 start_codon:yes stop_codon:yes gene_type:complete